MKNILFLSVGMPRAGSGWHYNLVHDLVVANGGQDARRVRQKYHLQRFLTEINCNIATLKAVRLLPVLIPTFFGNTFAIKTHSAPSRTATSLIENKRLMVTYIYRDPRAVMLSAYEYGQKGLLAGRPNAFSDLTDMDRAAEFMQRYILIWEAWIRREDVLHVRFEDLLQDYEQETSRLLDFFEVDRKVIEKEAVLDRYRPEHGVESMKGMHFSKGQAERFRAVFSPEQLEKLTDRFSTTLVKMGYPS